MVAAITEKQLQFEAQFMNEYWNLRKSIATTEPTEKYWENVFKSLTDLEVKYTKADPQDALYYKGVILACMNDLQHKDETRKFRSKVEADFVHGINVLRKLSGLPLVEVEKK